MVGDESESGPLRLNLNQPPHPLPTPGNDAQTCTTAQALALFDQLDPVSPAELLGDWRGQSLATGHPLDGMLEAWHWHGKRFVSEEIVHPLIFKAAGGHLISVDPGWVPLALLRAPWVGRLTPLARLAPALLPLLATTAPRARLRQIWYRSRLSTAMLYDQLPIIDIFRRLDSDTLLGLMDARGLEQPFVFTLRREHSKEKQHPAASIPGNRLES